MRRLVIDSSRLLVCSPKVTGPSPNNMDANSPGSIGRHWQESSHADLHVGCCTLSLSLTSQCRQCCSSLTLWQVHLWCCDFAVHSTQHMKQTHSTWNRHRSNNTWGSCWSLSAMSLSVITVLMSVQRHFWALNCLNNSWSMPWSRRFQPLHSHRWHWRTTARTQACGHWSAYMLHLTVATPGRLKALNN